MLYFKLPEHKYIFIYIYFFQITNIFRFLILLKMILKCYILHFLIIFNLKNIFILILT